MKIKGFNAWVLGTKWARTLGNIQHHHQGGHTSTLWDKKRDFFFVVKNLSIYRQLLPPALKNDGRSY